VGEMTLSDPFMSASAAHFRRRTLKLQGFFCVAVAVAVLLSFVAQASASQPLLACDGSSIEISELRGRSGNAPTTPPESPRPVPIEIGLEITELNAIDPLASSFRFEGYADFLLCDPRSAFDPETEGAWTRRHIGTSIEDPLWNIKLHVSNGIGAIEVTQRLVEIDANGSIRASGFFNSEVATGFDLRHFPFDRQVLEIHLESFVYDTRFVRFVTDDRLVSVSDEIQSTEWRVDGIHAHVTEHRKARQDLPYSRAVVSIDVSREWGFYLSKLWVPLALIVALSWSVFWMSDESLANRIRIAATAFLTVVAYQFAVSGSLPKVAYLTLMDRLMMGSFVLIALSALESMVCLSLRTRDRGRAVRLDRASRWLFPASYVGGAVVMWLYYAP
jgi:hypothetical protein